MFSHILVPLDCSTLAECALPHAVTLAKAFGSKVTLLHILTGAVDGEEEHQPDPLEWHLHKIEAEKYIESLVERLYAADISASGIVMHQDHQPERQIVRYAHEHDVDLIILSSHGAGGLSGWNISSVVHKVVLRSHRSIFIVRAYQTDPADPQAVHYRRILVPLDGSLRATVAMAPATALARASGAHLLLGHVVYRPAIFAEIQPASHDSELVDQLANRNREQASAYLARMQTEHAEDAEIHLLVSDDVAYSLHELVEREHVDLVVLSAHGWSGKRKWPYGSLATSFIVYGTTSILIVQDLPPHEFDATPAEGFEQKEYAGHGDALAVGCIPLSSRFKTRSLSWVD
jgi:nucleotide-binding universal stress UspA family protein